MILKELKEWLNKLPTKYSEYEIVISRYGILTEETTYRLDVGITDMGVDNENKEITFTIPNDEEQRKIKSFEQFINEQKSPNLQC